MKKKEKVGTVLLCYKKKRKKKSTYIIKRSEMNPVAKGVCRVCVTDNSIYKVKEFLQAQRKRQNNSAHIMKI